MPSAWSDEKVLRVVRAEAGRVRRHSVFAPHEQADIEQEMLTHLLVRAELYDADRCSPEGYARTVLRNFGKDMVRRRTKAAAGPGLQVSVEVCATGDVDICGSALDQQTFLEWTRGGGRCAQSETDLRLDLSGIVRRLGDVDRQLCTAVQRTDTMVEAARSMGIRRSTVRDRVQRLTPEFADLRPPGTPHDKVRKRPEPG